MICNRASQIQCYHDGELPPAERAELDAHLQTCTVCHELLADLRSLSARIAEAPLAGMPRELLHRLQTQGAAVRDRGLIRISGWLTAAAAVVLIGVLLNRQPEPADTVLAPAAWETLALLPAAEESDEPNGEQFATAQWMAEELSSSETW